MSLISVLEEKGLEATCGHLTDLMLLIITELFFELFLEKVVGVAGVEPTLSESKSDVLAIRPYPIVVSEAGFEPAKPKTPVLMVREERFELSTFAF